MKSVIDALVDVLLSWDFQLQVSSKSAVLKRFSRQGSCELVFRVSKADQCRHDADEKENQ